MKKIENERNIEQEEELVEIRKRFMVLFLYFKIINFFVLKIKMKFNQ